MAATVPRFISIAAAVHRQDRAPTSQKHPDMAAFSRLVGCPLPFKPSLELCAGHRVNICVHQGCRKYPAQVEHFVVLDCANPRDRNCRRCSLARRPLPHAYHGTTFTARAMLKMSTIFNRPTVED
jgi:hypothetical protein